MESENVKKYFEKLDVVCDYARAVEKVGLWESEKIVFAKNLKKRDEILELGCGAGRIAHGLNSLGFEKITATDFSENMVDVAKAIAEKYGDKIIYRVEDARALTFADASFDAAIFGFNGLMQIPQRQNRRKALNEIHRVLRPNAILIFTTHDRDAPAHSDFWKDEQARWQNGSKPDGLDEFGDKFYFDGECGNIFIHSPVFSEVEEDLSFSNFQILARQRRSEIAVEPENVVEFSDECVFWIVKKI